MTEQHTAAADSRPLVCAHAIHDGLREFLARFRDVTLRARSRFDRRDWIGARADAVERLDLYGEIVERMVAQVRRLAGARAANPTLWRNIKRAYEAIIEGSRNMELAETFFNSVSRTALDTVGVRAATEFVTIDTEPLAIVVDPGIYLRADRTGSTRDLLLRIFAGYPFASGYTDLERDAMLAAQRIDDYLASLLGDTRLDAVETLRPVFYRGKGAYIVGRVRTGDFIVPLVLPLRHDEAGIAVDAVLMDENEISILFSFARSYFHVEAPQPRELIAFLKSIMPLKPVAELYSSLGFHKHGKTELFHDLKRHLDESSDRFRIAQGDRGMVMVVFTLTEYDVVFKIIRDVFDYPKRTTRQAVRDRYRLVFQHDRVGRLVDAQEFDHLTFRKGKFDKPLLDELLASAAETVSLHRGRVVIKHLYTERKMIPLNLYLRSTTPEQARAAVIDYGYAIKELAAANIFPGDFLLKNFGVTRHGRVVFYDYDELCLLTDCHFRRMPRSRTAEEELASEPWFTVDEMDIFPEEFRRFLGIPGPLRDVFSEHHEDLFSVEFWRGLQERHGAGEIMDFYPYPQARRL